MTELPTIEELIGSYDHIPQNKLLAWWKSKGIKWNDQIQNASVHLFLLEVKKVWGGDLVSKIELIEKIPYLSQKDLNELIDEIETLRMEIETHFQQQPEEIRHFTETQQFDHEKLIYFFNAPPEKRAGSAKLLKAIDKREKTAIEFLKSNRHNEAAIFFEQVLSFYAQEPLQDLNSFDPDRARTTMSLGTALYSIGDYKGAIRSCKQAQALYEGDFCKDRIEFDPDRARTAIGLGNALDSTGDHEGAIRNYKQAQALYEGSFCKGRIAFDPDRAGTVVNLGTALDSTGDYEGAIRSCKQAQALYEGGFCKGQIEFDPGRAIAAINLGNALSSKGDYKDAIKSFEQAQALYEGGFCKGRIEFDHGRALTALKLGIALSSIGDYEGSIKSFEQAQKLYEGDFCKDRIELDPDRTRTAFHLGIALSSIGDYKGSIKSFEQAQKLYEGGFCKGQIIEFEHFYALLAMNLGVILGSMGDYEGAIRSLKQAQALYEGDFCKDRIELDPDRAITAMNLGNALGLKGDYEGAIESYEQAKAIYEGDFCKGRIKFDPDSAGIAVNLGLTLGSIGEYEGAIKSFEQAQKLYEGETVDHWLPLNHIRCSLYANTSHLLNKMDKPLVWARQKSELLIRLLELAPDRESATEGTAPTWEKMRRNFAVFHANWLSFVIDQQQYEEIPRILFCIQGRELASEVLDELEEVEEHPLPDQVKVYLKLRQQLRKMIQRKKGGSAATTDPFGPGARSLDQRRQSKELEAEKEAIAEYNQLHNKMVAARHKASKLPGYEFLELPYDTFTLESIQAIQDFHSHQKLLLMIHYEEVQGVLIIKKQGSPKWIPLNGMDELVKQTELLSGDRYSYYGKYRRNTHDERRGKKDIPVMSAAERSRFWPDMIRKLREKFWSTIEQHIGEENELVILPQGSLKQLPVLAGKPEEVTTVFYPGLIYYALQTGLIKRNEQESVQSTYYPAALLYYDHRHNPKTFLPGVEKEVEAIRAVHQQHNSLCESLEYPAPFPDDPLEIELLTGIGHGGDDPHMPFSTAMEVSRDQFFGYQDILSGRAKVQHAFFNTCLIAMNRDDSRGNPMGLSSAFLRKGARSVTGFLYPISDLFASCFGPIFHKHWLESRTKDLKTVLCCTRKEFMESALDLLKQNWLPKLKREVANYTTVREKTQAQLTEAFELDKDGAAQISRLIEHYEGPEEELPALVINTLTELKSAGLNGDDPPLMAIGTILYGIRTYGR